MLFGVLSKVNNPIVCADIGRAIVGQQVAASARNSGPTRLLSVNAWGRRRPMASSGSTPIFGDVHIDDMISNRGKGVDFAKPGGVYFTDGIHSSCQKATISMRSREPPISYLVCGYSMVAVVPRKCNISSLSASFRNVHTASPLCFAARATHDFSFDGSSLHEQPLNSAVSLNQTLKLLSGSCYLPHPDKEETGGEDAHFICVEEQSIGVADGVGGWADVGINSGLFSRELMSNSVAAIQEEPKGFIDPARVLDKAHSGTKAKGSSTACIITLAEKGLNAINLGDSGFIVVRDGSTIFESPVQQHGFNFTYQLESGNTGDLPSSGQVFTISVAPGDVVIAGTDGLFDNLYNNEVTAALVHALKEGLEPQQTAQKIAALARQRAQDRHRQTPFSTAAQDAGFRYYGGKLDDITVVVSYITSCMNV